MSDPIEFAYAGLDANGTITNLRIFETLPVNETHVIALTENWGVNIDWTMDGASLLFPPWAGTHWELRYFLESIGTNNEYNLPAAPVSVPWGGLATPKLFSNSTTILTGVVTQAGPYKMAVMLQLFDGATPLAITGFVEGPVVVFY